MNDTSTKPDDTTCLKCKQPRVLLRKVNKEDGKEYFTGTTLYFCVNRKCSVSVVLDKVKNWK